MSAPSAKNTAIAGIRKYPGLPENYSALKAAAFQEIAELLEGKQPPRKLSWWRRQNWRFTEAG